jgi:hypothetical protein
MARFFGAVVGSCNKFRDINDAKYEGGAIGRLDRRKEDDVISLGLKNWNDLEA